MSAAPAGTPQRCPVAICGAGPVGLTLALELAQWGVPVTIVERHHQPLAFPKGRALSTRTMEIFRQLGLEAELTAVGLPRHETMHFFYGTSLTAEQFTRISNTPPRGGSPVSPTFTLACPQDRLEAILRAHATRHPLVDLRCGLTVVASVVGDEQATVEVEDEHGARHLIECRWLVAADGADSMLRNLAGIGRTSWGPACDNVNILFEADLGSLIVDRSAIVSTISNASLHATVLTVDGRFRWLCNVIQPDGEPARLAADHRWCHDRVIDAIGTSVAVGIVDAMAWTATAANAATYRSGALLLVGDAAHVCTPYGGFGMNAGIADAHNLAWKLAAHVRHGAGDVLVDTYHDERHPIGERTTRESASRLEASVAAHVEGRTARGEVSANPSDGLVLGGRYESAAVVGPVIADAADETITTYTPSARPGCRAPHAWLADGRSTLDALGPHVTVVAGPSARASVPPLLAGLARVELVLDDEVDPDGAVRRCYEMADDDWVIVRPDGHVAARS